MTVQDDARESELINLFDLMRPENHTRSGVDALLELDGNIYEFELKSTSRGSVTTVRDFGMEHISKWEGKHWLIGVYDSWGVNLMYCLYGSPLAMSGWIQEKKNYIMNDFRIADIVKRRLGLEDMFEVIGKKEQYTLEDAKLLQKKQYSIAEYREMMDMRSGYSPERMLEMFRDRGAYLVKRGSTLNNPHIPKSYFRGWEQITHNHPVRLREMVKEAINQ
jgi:hypothetical protein